jgi:hypothetical protein
MVGIILRGLVVIGTDQMQLNSGRYTLRSLFSLDLSSSAGHPKTKDTPPPVPTRKILDLGFGP